MTQTQKLLAVAVALALGTGIYFVGKSRGQSDLDARLAQMEARQRTLEGGVLNRLPPGKLASQLGYGQARSAPPEGEDPSMNTPEAQERSRQQTIARLEREFRAEPVDGAWSADSRRLVDRAMVEAGAADGLRPKSMTSECRSRTCRIDVVLSSPQEYDALVNTFTTELAGRMAQTTMIPVTGPDGQVIMRIYATNPPPPPARRRPDG